jgi:plasmid stabilization system protein ParE
MTAVVTTTQAADDDIRNAAHYISQDSPLSAARFATEILECFQRIAEFPQSGREIDALATPLRRVRVSSRFRRWLVFYLAGSTGRRLKSCACCMAHAT